MFSQNLVPQEIPSMYTFQQKNRISLAAFGKVPRESFVFQETTPEALGCFIDQVICEGATKF